MFYSFLRILAYIVLMPIFFIRVEGKENLRAPKAGSVLISHHTSNWDAIILGFAVKHTPVCYLSKVELGKNRLARFFLKALHVIPIDRGHGDIVAVKTAIKAVRNGSMVGIFPEGTRSKNGSILEFNEGAALIALRGEVPVVPVYIKGGFKLFHQIRVIAGEPIDLRAVSGEKINSSALKQATQYMREKIVELSER